MRHIATLADEEAARTFTDYLLTLRIESRLDRQPDGWDLWVCDEDRVEQARAELAEFTRNPTDPRYTGAIQTATALRREHAQTEEQYRRRQQTFQKRMDRPAAARPITILLITLSILVAVVSNLGNDWNVLGWLSIAPVSVDPQTKYQTVHLTLRAIWEGQVWRLITPIFIHFGPLHLVFNLLMLYSLGGRIEATLGATRYLLLVLVLAVASNLAQFYLGHVSFEAGEWIFRRSPKFGGMSGVLYGLFGYAAVRTLYRPDLPLGIDRNTVFIMMLWFFLCWAGVIGSIANMAHTAGLVLGLVIGYLPQLRRGRGD
jgi:GlpG protein